MNKKLLKSIGEAAREKDILIHYNFLNETLEYNPGEKNIFLCLIKRKSNIIRIRKELLQAFKDCIKSSRCNLELINKINKNTFDKFNI